MAHRGRNATNIRVAGLELVGASKRGLVSVIILTFNSVGMMLLATLALLFTRWRALQLAVSLPGVVMCLVYIW